MKIALCQMKVTAKDPSANLETALRMLNEAHAAGAAMAVYPEMFTGYMVGDLWEDTSYLCDCERANVSLSLAAASLGMGVVFGGLSRPSGGQHDDGRALRYNSAYVLPPGGLTPLTQAKVNLPNYREFDDKRYFTKGDTTVPPLVVDCQGGLLVTTSLCEDGWDESYPNHPIAEASAASHAGAPDNKAHLHLNLSCSPFTEGKNAARNRRFSEHSKGFDVLCYVNSVGIQNNGKGVFTFDGTTTVYKAGGVVGSLPALKECIGYLEVGKGVCRLEGHNWLPAQKDPRLSEVLVYGIKEFMGLCGLSKVVIGLSGGIDSALSAMLHVKALGKDNVVLVNMPTEHNSSTTKGIAATIASNLGCPYMVVPIGDLCHRIESAIDQPFKDVYKDDGGMGFVSKDTAHPLFSVSESYQVDSENIAARMRGPGIQAALAAGLKAVFPNNGNKSELTVGYTTIGGDLSGYLAPLADLWKTEVYAMARELSDEMGGILPNAIFTLKPSAELSANHNVDEGKGDPIVYWYHDKLFSSWMEPWNRSGIEGTLTSYMDGTLLSALGLESRASDFQELFPDAAAFVADAERWWGLFTGLAIVKRVQAPPVLALKRRSYGYDFREAIGGQGLSKGYKAIKAELLGGAR